LRTRRISVVGGILLAPVPILIMLLVLIDMFSRRGAAVAPAGAAADQA
jgi:hypothetical protein